MNDNPYWELLPINNRNTAWRDFGLPTILIVPHRRDTSGLPLANSGIFNVRIAIENVPREALVAGHQNIGRRFPDRELYAQTVNAKGITERYLTVSDYPITRAGVAIDYENAQNGDLIAITSSTGVTDTIPYIDGADYYDFSDIKLDVELLPQDRYNLVYQAEYFNRVIAQDGSNDFLCIDSNQIGIASLKFQINHPGEVINEFYNLTPPKYLTDATKSKDTTVAFYRPFTDILQDIFDEQGLLEKLNWVFDAPAEAIPYLSSLLGWELPYFQQSLDSLRRAVLRRTVEFQNMAGSRHVMINLFRLFGFEILISNLWWSTDGKRFIRPGERLPSDYQDQEITIDEVCQVDPLIINHQTKGFSTSEIPLLYRPQVKTGFGDFEAARDGGDVTIEAYNVSPTSEAFTKLQELSEEIKSDPDIFGITNGCTTNVNDFITSNKINETLNGLVLIGHSQILLRGKLGDVAAITVSGEAPILESGISFDRENNNLSITLNGYITGESAIFVFALYKKQTITVPEALKDLQSNRFDIQILTQDLENFADPVTLEFATEFLYRLKAFHSLLNVIRTRVEFTETYEVTGICIGGDIAQRYDTELGTLQVPPAIIPDVPENINNCTRLDPTVLGYKPQDITLRLRKLENLIEEFVAYKDLDSRDDDPIPGSRLASIQKADRDQCFYTHKGQDRIVGERVETHSTEIGPSPNSGQQAAGIINNIKLSPVDTADNGNFNNSGATASSNSNSQDFGSFTVELTEIRESFCELDGITDYCYKGRVDDEILHRQALVPAEHPRCKPCSLGQGVGLYYTYPAFSQVTIGGVKNPGSSKSGKIQFSGGATDTNIQHYLNSILKDSLSSAYNQKLPMQHDTHLGRLYRDYGVDHSSTIHYTNDNDSKLLDQRYNLAIERPSLEIEKTNMHFPGCRFPSQHALEDDFTHPEWDARPWDDLYSTYCGANARISNDPTFLNAVLVEGDDGNESLEFDEVPFFINGNGLIPDIATYGDHTLDSAANIDESDVVHKIYMRNATSPYVILDQVCDVTDGATISTDEPLFSSYMESGTEYVDYADGYPCETGYITEYEGENFDWFDVLDALGMNTSQNTSDIVLFRYGSGVRISEDGIRHDCGCLLVGVNDEDLGDIRFDLLLSNPTLYNTAEIICGVSKFIDDDGYYDWDCDHISIEQRLVPEEEVGTHSNRFDGSIPSFLETL